MRSKQVDHHGNNLKTCIERERSRERGRESARSLHNCTEALSLFKFISEARHKSRLCVFKSKSFSFARSISKIYLCPSRLYGWRHANQTASMLHDEWSFLSLNKRVPDLRGFFSLSVVLAGSRDLYSSKLTSEEVILTLVSLTQIWICFFSFIGRTRHKAENVFFVSVKLCKRILFLFILLYISVNWKKTSSALYKFSQFTGSQEFCYISFRCIPKHASFERSPIQRKILEK